MGKTHNVGGARGGYSGNGNVYLMRNGQSEYKIGCSKDPTRRLKEIKTQRPKVKLLTTIKATEMNRAGTVAQQANLGVGNKRATRGASDWFIKANGNTWKSITNTTRNAVYRLNHTMKTRGKRVKSKKR